MNTAQRIINKDGDYRLVCVETGKSTAINLSQDEPWEDDEILDAAANRILKREPDHKHYFVCIQSDKMRSEICHALADLTEHTGEYRTFKIREITANERKEG